MANDEHLGILKQGARAWNEWRITHPEIEPDFSGADLTSLELSIDHSPADPGVSHYFNFTGANLASAKLIGANLSNTNLGKVDLFAADLSEANLSGAKLWFTYFHRTRLTNADFSGSSTLSTSFLDTDLSVAKGLDSVTHFYQSFIDIYTLYKSAGKISQKFLRGCGFPDDFITFIPSHFGIQQAIEFYSCFISYSHRDEDFAKRLYSRMRDEHLRVWFAPEDVKGGEKLHEQIERAIQLHDRLLIVLSDNSIYSQWVMTEIRNARRIEVEENRRKLFPIRLVDFDVIRKWKCFDADTGKDLAVELREYFIPDFSNWKDHDSFETAFKKLLSDLRAQEKKQDMS